MRKIIATLLLFIGVALIVTAGYVWYNSQQIPLQPLVEAIPDTTTTLVPSEPLTTTTVPVPQGDFETEPAIEVDEESKSVELAPLDTLEIPDVDISASVETVSPAVYDSQGNEVVPAVYNSCGRQNDPCIGRNMLDAWEDEHRVGVCEAGPSFITGHTTSGDARPDTFTNLIDDWEFNYDEGVTEGTEVLAILADGSQCIGTVVDFVDGPGEKLADSPARYVDKILLTYEAAIALTEIAGSDSVGFLLTSYCGPGPKCEWYSPSNPLVEGDNTWHRRYTAIVMVEWEQYVSTETLATGVSER